MKKSLLVKSTLSLLTINLLAQDIVQLESFTVTASRENESQVKQALKIDKKDQKEIESDQVIFQKDLLNSMSGVLVTQTSSGIGHKLSVRTPITTQPYFLYLQDNVPIQSSGFFNHNGLAYTNFETANSAEVLKGAGTALYGSDAVAAVVNIQSSQPTKELSSKVKINVGSDGFRNMLLGNSNTIDDRSSYSFDISVTDNEGWRDHTNYNRIESSGKYNYVVNDENIIDTSFSFNKTDAEQAGSLIGEDELKNNASSVGDVANALTKVNLRRKFDFARISTKWDNYSFDDLEISNILYLRANRNRYTTTWENNLPSNDSKTKSLGLMNKTTQDLDSGKNIFGFDVEYTKGNREYTQDFDYVSSGYGSSVDEGVIYDYSVNYLSLSPYFQNDWNITKELKLTTGMRYDYNSFDYTNNTESGQYRTSNYYRPDNRKDTFNHLSPKLSLSYFFEDKSQAYLRYANGFRIPSSSRLYSQQKTSGVREYTLDPETTNTYELGFKKVFDKSYVDIALFYMDIKDTITRRTDNNGDRYYNNGGESINKGIELTYNNKFSNLLSTKLAYSYTKSNYKNDSEYGNNELSSAPRHKANLKVFITPTSKFTLVPEVEYLSSYFMDNDNEHKYSGYTIVNIKANYDATKKLRFFSKVTNISDKKYAQSASYSYGKEKYTPASPRQMYIGMEYKF